MHVKQKQLFAGAASVTALLLLAGCGPKAGGGGDAAKGENGKPGAAAGAAEATPVRVTPASMQTVTRSIPITGSLAALQTVQITPKVTGRILEVLGREGAVVRKGEIVARQETEDASDQLRQAEANLQAARARLSQAQTQARLQTTQNATGITDAQQALQAAQSQLAIARRPQRTQEVAVAQNAVAQAQANYERAATDRKRYDQLVQEGAAAQITLDQYVTNEKVTKAALDTAKQQLNIAQTGGRTEQIQNAETAVRRAQGQLRLARANNQQSLVREDDIRAAQATVAQNQAAVALARQQIGNADIRSPIDGVISERLTEPGQLATPAAAVARVISLDTVYFEAQVPETAISELRAGLPVTVKVDAFPGRSFDGKIVRVNPSGNASSRTFNVRINLPNNKGLLRPGMFARGGVIAERRRGVVVSKDALIPTDGKFQLFVAETENKATLRTVTVGIETAQTTEVTTGLKEGERVIVAGQDGLKDGAAISIQPGDGGGAAAKSAASGGGAAGA